MRVKKSSRKVFEATVLKAGSLQRIMGPMTPCERYSALKIICHHGLFVMVLFKLKVDTIVNRNT
jgi:hypothetical protein